MKEIVIGADVEPIYNSINLWYDGDVSENSVFYILWERLSDTRIYVYKESSEGAGIKEWLSHKENRDNYMVQRKAIEFLLPRLSVDEFLEIIERKNQSSYDKGYRQAQYAIKKVLGLA